MQRDHRPAPPRLLWKSRKNLWKCCGKLTSPQTPLRLLRYALRDAWTTTTAKAIMCPPNRGSSSQLPRKLGPLGLRLGLRPRQANRKASPWSYGVGRWKKRTPPCNGADRARWPDPRGCRRPLGASSRESLENPAGRRREGEEGAPGLCGRVVGQPTSRREANDGGLGHWCTSGRRVR